MTTNQTLDICDGESIQTSGGQTKDGLSDSNINNPVASPTKNVTYIATVIHQ